MRASPFRCLLLALSATALHAGDAPAGPPPLGLPEAIALAHQRNETRDIAAARLQHALALRRQSLALLLPSVSASGSLQKSSISHRPFAHNVSEQDGAQVDVDLTLFNATSIDSLRAASASVSAQELDSADLRRALAFQVASGFVTTLAAEHQLQAAQQRREVAAQTAQQTRARVQAGVATANDATRSDLELATAELTVTNDRQAVLAARLSLGDLIGRAVDEPLAEPPAAPLPSRDLAQLESLALQERPDLQSGALRIRANDLQAQGTRLGLVPTVGVRGSYQLSHSDPPPLATTSPEWQVALVATWDLYDGGNREAVADALDADRREAVATLASTKRALHRDLATTLGALATAETALAQAGRQLEVARINAAEVQARFRQGLATALETADANASVFQAESDLASRRLDLQSSGFQVRELVGRWPLADAPPPEPTPATPR
jgi:outer membrane protein TolC